MTDERRRASRADALSEAGCVHKTLRTAERAPIINNIQKHVTVFVYDGDCAFCTTWVKRLQRNLGVFPEAQPWQWLALDELGLTESDVRRAAWLLLDGRRFRGHAAFAALLRLQHHVVLRFIGNLMTTPPYSWVARLGYIVIARFRHQLPGGTPACALPKPNM